MRRCISNLIQNAPEMRSCVTILVNILINDVGSAILCDFGLSRMRDDVTIRSTVEVVGNRNWMAPERLMGRALKPPSDIYALGMTIYEVSGSMGQNFTLTCSQVHTGEIPLIGVSPAELRDLVVNHELRPDRPDDDDAPQLD